MTDIEPDDFDKQVADVTRRIAAAADLLREHCDSVAIIVTVAEGDSSQMSYSTRGSIYAIEGSVSRFLDISKKDRGVL